MEAATILCIHLLIQFSHSRFHSAKGTMPVPGHSKVNTAAPRLQVNTVTQFWAGVFHVCDGSHLHTWTVSTSMDSQVSHPAFPQLGLGT